MATTAISSAKAAVQEKQKVQPEPESRFMTWFEALRERARHWSGGIQIEPLTEMEYQWIHHKELHW